MKFTLLPKKKYGKYRILIASLLVAVLAYLVFQGGHFFPDLKQEYRVRSCSNLGAVDAPQIVDDAPSQARIAGWVADHAGVERIELVAGDVVLSTVVPGAPRKDVSQAFPACPVGAARGFALPIEIGRLGPGHKELVLYAVKHGNSRYKLGIIPAGFFPMIAHVESRSSIEWDNLNRVAGWGFAQGGPVKVSVLAGGKPVASTLADKPREDVGKVYPLWPGAARSGFEIMLRMVDMPRGRYRLGLVFDDGLGHKKSFQGPEVMNDLPIGKVVGQADRLIDPVNVHLDAWLADEDGILSAKVETESGVVLGALHLQAAGVPLSALPDPRFGSIQRDDVSIKSGGLYAIDIPRKILPVGLSRLVARVRDRSGREAVISSGPLVLRSGGEAPPCQGRILRVFYPGGAVNFRDGFRQMSELRDMAQGGCVEIGLRGRTEYLRTTFGKARDFQFDPDFPEALRKRSSALEMTGESIRELLNTALRFKAPLLVTLDGGVWADAKFPAPDVDVVDNLEEDPRTVQWNQFGRAEADDALEHLPGATASPQLARMMSLNRYNRKFLEYKKRNLQAAIGVIVQFMHQHPQVYVAVNLDPDQYINPWFFLTQWYDYNPDTLRQYREWLFNLGPYADGGKLAFSRHEPRLTLKEANTLAKQSWKTLDKVDPPRGTPDYNDPWQQLWTQFKRHLVARHYDDLAEWAAQAGMPEDRIFTSQTFIQTEVATKISDPATGWTDQAGVSIEGAKPRHGRLGAILYGPASRNEGKVRSGTSLIDNIRRTDPEWGVVEFHPATIAFPDKLPTHAEAYTTLFNLINGGARFLSPMWGSYAGDRTVHPRHFKAYDAMEGTVYEYQFVWWLREMRFLPVGGMLYPFGNEQVRSSDGWMAGEGTSLAREPGFLRLSGSGSRISLISPAWEGGVSATGYQVEVRGKWAGNMAVSIKLLFRDGHVEKLAPSHFGSGLAIFRLVPSSALKNMEIEWIPTPASEDPLKVVDVDSITVRN